MVGDKKKFWRRGVDYEYDEDSKLKHEKYALGRVTDREVFVKVSLRADKMCEIGFPYAKHGPKNNIICSREEATSRLQPIRVIAHLKCMPRTLLKFIPKNITSFHLLSRFPVLSSHVRDTSLHQSNPTSLSQMPQSGSAANSSTNPKIPQSPIVPTFTVPSTPTPTPMAVPVDLFDTIHMCSPPGPILPNPTKLNICKPLPHPPTQSTLPSRPTPSNTRPPYPSPAVPKSYVGDSYHNRAHNNNNHPPHSHHQNTTIPRPRTSNNGVSHNGFNQMNGDIRPPRPTRPPILHHPPRSPVHPYQPTPPPTPSSPHFTVPADPTRNKIADSEIDSTKGGPSRSHHCSVIEKRLVNALSAFFNTSDEPRKSHKYIDCENEMKRMAGHYSATDSHIFRKRMEVLGADFKMFPFKETFEAFIISLHPTVNNSNAPQIQMVRVIKEDPDADVIFVENTEKSEETERRQKEQHDRLKKKEQSKEQANHESIAEAVANRLRQEFGNNLINRDYRTPPATNRDYSIPPMMNRDYRTTSATNRDYSNPLMMNGDYRTTSAMNGDFPSPSPYSLFPTSGEPPVYNQTLNIFNQMPSPPQAPPAPPTPVTVPVPLLCLPYFNPFIYPPAGADMGNFPIGPPFPYATPDNMVGVGEEAIDVVSVPNYNDDVAREETVYTEQSVAMDYDIPTVSLSSTSQYSGCGGGGLQIAEEEEEREE